MASTSLAMVVSCNRRESDVSVTICLDGKELFRSAASDTVANFATTLDLEPGQHVLSFEMMGKTQSHTKVNADGKIIEDLIFSIRDVTLDCITLDQHLWRFSRYCHDFNGSKERTIDKFYGTMGCNGQVIFDFSTPVGVWFLENLIDD